MKKNIRQSALAFKAIVVERGAFKLVIPNLAIRHGEIVCFVGPNGCGKTSLLLTALGLLPHKGGCFINGARYDGTDPVIKSKIGFIPDDPDLLLEELTAREQWSVTAAVLARLRPHVGAKQIMEQAVRISHAIAFEPPAQMARNYSHGMRKKTQIVSALMGEPDIIVVDELRNGLDPIAIRQTEELIKKERERGAAIMAATHDLWWAERFADCIYVLYKGRIVAEGTRKQLLKKGEPDLETAFYRIIGAGI